MTTNVDRLREVSKRRKVYLRGEKLTERRAKKVISKIRSLSRTGKPIGLWIDHSGGSTKWAIEICKAIKDCPAPVYAYVTRAHSSALMILQACDLRIGRPKSKYVVHFPGFYLFLVRPYEDKNKVARMVRELYETMEPGLREHPHFKAYFSALYEKASPRGKSKEEVIKLLLSKKTLSAEEALEWGFIEEVVKL